MRATGLLYGMQPIDLLQYAFLAGALIIWFMYVREAFRLSAGQGFMTLLVPFYAFYFAFVRSPRSRPLRLALVTFTCLFLLLA